MKKFNSFLAVTFAAAVGLVAVLGASSSARADAILTTPVPGTAARNNFSGTIGFEFTVGGSDIFVTALGFEDAGLDGLSTAHDVGIWDAGGALLASVNVPAGSGATLDNAWRYVDLPSQLTLSSGTTYWLGGETFAGGDAWSDNTASLTVAPEVSYIRATFASNRSQVGVVIYGLGAEGN